MNGLINLNLAFKKYKIQFIFLFLFWFGALLFFFFTQPGESLWGLFLLSITVRTPDIASDFAGFYFLMLPIFLEVIVLGFIMGELMEKYNPIVTSRILAKHRSNHTIIIGYGHLSRRIVEHCIEESKQFVVIEDDEEVAEDLISNGYPVVIGDATDLNNLVAANVKKAKEIFVIINDVRVAIMCVESVRKLNKDCPIYVRIFEDHVQDYLRQAPLRAFPFSTSKATMEGIKEWTERKTGKAIIIGRDHLTHRIAFYISQQAGREAYLFDDEHDGIEFVENNQLHIINEFACFLSDLRDHIDLDEVTQVFISWKRDTEFDEAIYLASKLHLRYPDIEVYARVFDEEIIELMNRFNAKSFSSSRATFKFLQHNVAKDSAIRTN